MRDIITGGQLPTFDGKAVSITGLVTKVDLGGLTFSIRSADGVIVSVILEKKFDKVLEGYVEVHGTVKGKTVYAEHCISFSNKEFDEENHVKLCKLLQSVPDLWKTK